MGDPCHLGEIFANVELETAELRYAMDKLRYLVCQPTPEEMLAVRIDLLQMEEQLR